VRIRIFTVLEFIRFMKKERLSADALVEAIERKERGLMDTDLGGGLIKL